MEFLLQGNMRFKYFIITEGENEEDVLRKSKFNFETIKNVFFEDDDGELHRFSIEEEPEVESISIVPMDEDMIEDYKEDYQIRSLAVSGKTK